MNKKQRADLEKIKDTLDDLVNEVQFMADEEEEKFNNAPENLQDSEKYQTISAIADSLSSAVSSLESAASDIDEALSN